MRENTTIQIRKSTKKILDSLKISKRQSYIDLIENLIEDSQELSEETLENIRVSEEEI